MTLLLAILRIGRIVKMNQTPSSGPYGAGQPGYGQGPQSGPTPAYPDAAVLSTPAWLCSGWTVFGAKAGTLDFDGRMLRFTAGSGVETFAYSSDQIRSAGFRYSGWMKLKLNDGTVKKLTLYNISEGGNGSYRARRMAEAAVPVDRQWVAVLKAASVMVEGDGKTSSSTYLKVVLVVLLMVVAVTALVLFAAALFGLHPR